MTPRRKVHVGARLPTELIRRIDDRAEEWRCAVPSIEITRTDILRMLIEAGLEHPGTSPPRPVHGS